MEGFGGEAPDFRAQTPLALLNGGRAVCKKFKHSQLISSSKFTKIPCFAENLKTILIGMDLFYF